MAKLRVTDVVSESSMKIIFHGTHLLNKSLAKFQKVDSHYNDSLLRGQIDKFIFNTPKTFRRVEFLKTPCQLL